MKESPKREKAPIRDSKHYGAYKQELNKMIQKNEESIRQHEADKAALEEKLMHLENEGDPKKATEIRKIKRQI